MEDKMAAQAFGFTRNNGCNGPFNVANPNYFDIQVQIIPPIADTK